MPDISHCDWLLVAIIAFSCLENHKRDRKQVNVPFLDKMPLLYTFISTAYSRFVYDIQHVLLLRHVLLAMPICHGFLIAHSASVDCLFLFILFLELLNFMHINIKFIRLHCCTLDVVAAADTRNIDQTQSFNRNKAS